MVKFQILQARVRKHSTWYYKIDNIFQEKKLEKWFNICKIFFIYSLLQAMTEKKSSKTPRRHYAVFWLIVVILFVVLKSCSDSLETNEQKIERYKQEIQQIEDKKENQEYENALKRAKLYYDQWFSKEKIKEILVWDIEKFTEEVAQYAIDNL